jgi:TRAP-type C4-dicarboxylate transport system permease large subunit
MHLRSPSVDHGVQSFLWALVFFLYLWFGMRAVGVSPATSFVLALVLAALIFVFVRIFGEDELARPQDRRRRRRIP